MGAEQAGMGREWMIFARFGVLHFVKQDRREKHRIQTGAAAFLPNHRLQFLQAIDRVVAQRRELVDPFGEQA
ncbi:MAG: hypothetical protein ACKOHJ_05185, partial [Vulcanococcus sp.]